MEQRFQNIIVGAGIAGLICGGYLSKHGQSTLILEKGRDIGGRIKVPKFGGYTVQEEAPTWYATWDGGFWPRAARELGVNVKFFIMPQPSNYLLGSYQAPKVIPVSYTGAALGDTIDSFSPEPFPTDVRRELESIFHELLAIPYKRLSIDLDSVRLKDWIESQSSSPMVHSFFAGLAATLLMMDSAHAWKVCSAGKIIALIRMWMAGDGFMTAVYPDTVKGLVKPFGEVVKSFGGEIRTQHEVTEVIVGGGKAVGVITKNEEGKEKKLYADRTIVNAFFSDIPKLFKELPPEVDEPIRKMAQEVQLIDYLVMTGLREKVTDNPSPVNIQDPKTGSNLGSISPQSLFMPWNVPPGKQLILYFRVYTREEALKLKPKDVIAQANNYLEEIYPGFKKAIEFQTHVAHAKLWQHQFLVSRIPRKPSSIDSLYFIGDGTTPQDGQGIDGAASTGMALAKSFLEIE